MDFHIKNFSTFEQDNRITFLLFIGYLFEGVFILSLFRCDFISRFGVGGGGKNKVMFQKLDLF